ncbi:MAG TPA: hypothetical protein VGE19_07400 [Pseudoxanthomonas sp.]
MDFVLIVLGILALAAFDRLFMPPLDPYGRRPLIEDLIGFVNGAAEGMSNAKRMEDAFLMQQKQQQYDHQQNAAQGGGEK